MMSFKLNFFVLLMIFSEKSIVQTPELFKHQLDSIKTEDQKFRPLFQDLLNPAKSDSLTSYYKMPIDKIQARFDVLQEKIDSSNLLFIENFITKQGYPGKSLVGEPTNEVAWYVIQHSALDVIRKYFPFVEKAGVASELPYTLVAMMQDRISVGQNKEQVYGTQVARRKLKSTNKETTIIWPIQNPENVNKMRKAVGFSNTIEEYARKFYIEYTKVKLDDILPIQ